MGFMDSFKTGLGAFGDFLGDVVGMAPTILPILQQTGVIPSMQTQPQMIRGPDPRQVFMPGGAVLPGGSFTQPVPIPSRLVNPVGFPTSAPSISPFAPTGVGMPALPSTRGGFSQAALTLPQMPGVLGNLGLPFVDIVGQGGGSALAALTSPFFPTMAGARAQAHIQANPVTGKLTWFKPAGKPILWSGDLTACKRVSRIARRARTASRKR